MSMASTENTIGFSGTREYRAGFGKFAKAAHEESLKLPAEKLAQKLDIDLDELADREELLDWCVEEFEAGTLEEPVSMGEFIGLVWMCLGDFGNPFAGRQALDRIPRSL